MKNQSAQRRRKAGKGQILQLQFQVWSRRDLLTAAIRAAGRRCGPQMVVVHDCGVLPNPRKKIYRPVFNRAANLKVKSLFKKSSQHRLHFFPVRLARRFCGDRIHIGIDPGGTACNVERLFFSAAGPRTPCSSDEDLQSHNRIESVRRESLRKHRALRGRFDGRGFELLLWELLRRELLRRQQRACEHGNRPTSGEHQPTLDHRPCGAIP